MHWANVIVLDQPFLLPDDAVRRAADEQYRPLLHLMQNAPDLALTVSISGALAERLERLDLSEVIDGLRTLAERGQIELAATAMHHPMLPLIPPGEAQRQIRLSLDRCRRIFGAAYQPSGFVPPDLAVSAELGRLVRNEGFAWLLCDETAHEGGRGTVDSDTRYDADGIDGLRLHLRDRALSALVGGAAPNAAAFSAALAARGGRGGVVTACVGGADDGLAPGHLRLLEELGRPGGPSTCRISDLPDHTAERVSVPLRASSAQVSCAELAEGVPYPQWDDPTNELQATLWRLTRLAIAAVHEGQGHAQARQLLDEALDSRPLRAASCRPWWDCRTVEEGARRLLAAVAALGSHGPERTPAQAHAAYREVLHTAEEWEYTGEARHRRARYLAGLADAGEAPPPEALV